MLFIAGLYMHAPSAGLLNLKKEEAILSRDYVNKGRFENTV
jgi:hypothetical protein